MKYSKLVSKKKQYKYSVNICLDLHAEERISDFIPNHTTIEIIREYLGGIIRGNADTHSRILYGSYGTGKSHLLTVLSAVLGHINVKSEGFKGFIKLISQYDNELASDIKNYSKIKNPYLVVPVYSDYSDFVKCITFSLKKELDRNGISVNFKGYYDEALELVNIWSSNEESLNRLKEECKKNNLKLTDLRKGLSSYDTNYEDLFGKIYKGMSYGAMFNSTAGNLIDNLNTANDAIKNSFRGIVFIFDEFGRYVEDYGEELKVKSIQDIAEYCDHSGNDNHIILVSHKQLSLYTRSMKKSVSDEWKKVEGRFKATSINIKYDQCLSLIGHIIPKTDNWESFRKKYAKELNELYNQAYDFKGFMLPPESEGCNPFEDGYPLHPITLFALDRLSKKVAQNERTFFTYLAGDDENALFAQLDGLETSEFHFIGLNSIYDYFEQNIKSYKTDEAYSTYKKLQRAINKLNSDSEDIKTKILKVMAVINIIGDSESLVADRNTLLSVVDGDNKKISSAIDILEKKKIIRYMRQYGYYDFFESSIFDIEEMIEEKIGGINDEMVVSVLNDNFSDFVLYPYEYNEKYFMNRVFLPIFATKSELNRKAFFNRFPDFYDGIVAFVLDEQADEEEYLSLSTLPQRTILLVNGKSKLLSSEVKRYIAIQYYYSKKEELAEEDPSVVNELKLYLSEQESVVSDLIKKWRSLQDKGTFVICERKKITVDSDVSLVAKLSEMMDKSFSKTLKVNNDLVNKNTLTGAMKQARNKALGYVINKDVNCIFDECVYLSPEFNILRSTLIKNGIIDSSILPDSCAIAGEKIHKLENGKAAGKMVMDKIYSLLNGAVDGKLPLKNLYNSLKSEPFGLRDGYIPIIVAFALKKYQNVSLYFHEVEHSYSGEELSKALEDADNYTLFICNWNEDEKMYIEKLEEIFKEFVVKGDSNNRLENLFEAMNNHYTSISKSARTTDIYVSDNTKRYRDIMNLSYKDYNGFFFKELPKIDSNLQELSLLVDDIKHELESVYEKQYVRALRVIKSVLNIKEKSDLKKSIQKIFLSEWNHKSQKAFDYTTNALLDIVSRTESLSEEQIVQNISKAITGFEIQYWTDSKIDEFEEKLKESVNKLNKFNPNASLQEGEMKVTIESAEGAPIISQFSKSELSISGKTMINKMKNTIDSFGESISYEEKISIIAQILADILR